MFELGKCYVLPNQKENSEVKNYIEESYLSLFVTGNKEPQSWILKSDESSFYYMKRWVDGILKRMNIEPTSMDDSLSQIYTLGLNYYYKNSLLVSFGKLSSKVLNRLDIKQDIYYSEFKWETLLKLATEKHITFMDLPKYPAVKRDLAMILDKSVKYEQLKAIAHKTCGNLLKQVNLFDVYEGQNIEKGKKSYALSYILQSSERTLSDDEINSNMDKLMKAYEKEVGAVIRM